MLEQSKQNIASYTTNIPIKNDAHLFSGICFPPRYSGPINGHPYDPHDKLGGVVGLFLADMLSVSCWDTVHTHTLFKLCLSSMGFSFIQAYSCLQRQVGSRMAAFTRSIVKLKINVEVKYSVYKTFYVYHVSHLFKLIHVLTIAGF